MRQAFAAVLLVAVVGCGGGTSPAPEPTDPAPAPAPTGLYTDAEIRALAKFDPDATAGQFVLNQPHLDVVPAGKAYPREQVFKALGLEDGRLRDFRESGFNHVVFLTWQVSPSYDIVCMTALGDPDAAELKFDDPKRKVYGIRLVKREE